MNHIMNMDEMANYLCKIARENGFKLAEFSLEKVEQEASVK